MNLKLGIAKLCNTQTNCTILFFCLCYRRPKKKLVVTKDEGATFDPMKYVKF
jgi:hypothetical protein